MTGSWMEHDRVWMGLDRNMDGTEQGYGWVMTWLWMGHDRVVDGK